MKHTAIIVEDSRLARNELKELLGNHKSIEVIAEAENVDNALVSMKNQMPDILFLDINLPEKNGFDLLEMLDEVPLVIFTTAFDEFAIKSFEYNALDYLLKPISQERFDKSMSKILETLKKKDIISNKKLSVSSQIFIKDGEKCWLVNLIDIQCFEVVGNYTRVYFKEEKALTYKSLNQIETKLPDDLFFRANRQQIISLNDIEKVDPWFNGKLRVKLTNNLEIEISRRQSIKFKEQLGL